MLWMKTSNIQKYVVTCIFSMSLTVPYFHYFFSCSGLKSPFQALVLKTTKTHVKEWKRWVPIHLCWHNCIKNIDYFCLHKLVSCPGVTQHLKNYFRKLQQVNDRSGCNVGTMMRCRALSGNLLVSSISYVVNSTAARNITPKKVIPYVG